MLTDSDLKPYVRVEKGGKLEKRPGVEEKGPQLQTAVSVGGIDLTSHSSGQQFKTHRGFSDPQI